MDYVDYPTALATISRVIRTDVMPAVSSAYARGQLWTSIGLLDNIAVELGATQAATAATAGEEQASLNERLALVIGDLETAIRGQAPLQTSNAILGAEAQTGSRA